jgi:pantetheine-phosphate adenylyltransferase
MALTNRSLAPDIETVFVMPAEDFSFLSSSMVKQAFALGGDLSRLVPKNVIDCLRRKMKREAGSIGKEA